jgi:hypothetical protein
MRNRRNRSQDLLNDTSSQQAARVRNRGPNYRPVTTMRNRSQVYERGQNRCETVLKGGETGAQRYR